MTTACETSIDEVESTVRILPRLVVVHTPEPATSHRAAYIAFAAICILWGTTFAAIAVAIETIPTLFVTGLRFTAAGGALFVIAWLTGARFPRRVSEWRTQIISGVLAAGCANALVVYAEHSLSSGLAALLHAMIPIWMAVMESFLGAARMTRRKIGGLALGFGGVGLLVAPAIGRPDVSLSFFLAVCAIQASAIAWNAGTLYSRRRGTVADPIAISAIQMLAAGIVVTIFAFIFGVRPTLAMFSVRSSLAMLYLTVFGSIIGFTAFQFALSRLSAGKVSSYAYVNPAVAVVVGALLLHEPVTFTMIVAMAVILAGVAMIQIERRTTVSKGAP